MGLLDILDGIFFGEEVLNRWAKERRKGENINGTKNNSFELKDGKKEEKEYEESIFHVKHISQDTWAGGHRNIYEKTVEGKIVGFEKRNNKIYLTLETPKGIDEMDFPYVSSFPNSFFSLIDRKDDLKNQKIKYFKASRLADTPEGPLNRFNYKIEVLEGTLKGEVFEKRGY